MTSYQENVYGCEIARKQCIFVEVKHLHNSLRFIYGVI